MAAQNHDQIFNQWVGKQVTIKGVGGTITRIPGEDGDSVRTRRRNVWSDTKFHTFVIERAPESQGEGLVAFRAKGTDLYLTISLYGDKARRGISSTLSRTPLHPDLVPVVVDFAVGRGDDNFEGKGFSYSPMTVEPGPPSLLQAFRLEQNFSGSLHRVGIKTRFGTYLRSQHWNSTVSQSPHLLGDETWYLAETFTQR
uniref:Uncharacterized protein n=1 Tax=Trieres chinensis TaxID=1514140 RepID=A0A7S2EW41_TRICV